MISKQKIKLIHSLELKKYRDQLELFVAEGPKAVGELLQTYECKYIAATSDWLARNKSLVGNNIETDTISNEELSKTSLLKTPREVIAVFKKSINTIPDINLPEHELCLALDSIQNPGNLGTIIRLANWFGINHIICSLTTVDAYSPKVIQATMGAIGKTCIHYCNLVDFFSSLKPAVPIYGTFLEGNNIYKEALSQNGIIIMGNEGNGICEDVAKFVNCKLFIPPFPNNSNTVESLNVSIATAIICSEFRRRGY